jgi:type IV fimbrial biogenesis protein FimT
VLVSPARAQGGFTVIEMMIAIALIALLTLFSMPMYRTWLQNSQLRASAESIAAGLQQARTEAVRLNDSQGVRFRLDGNAWFVERVSDGSLVQQGGGGDLSQNAVVTPTPSGVTQVIFNPLGQTNLAAPLDIDVTHADTANFKCIVDGGEARCLRVQVRAGGLVRLCDTSVTAAGDPRQCL